jgi:hypothetical protein
MTLLLSDQSGRRNYRELAGFVFSAGEINTVK